MASKWQKLIFYCFVPIIILIGASYGDGASGPFNIPPTRFQSPGQDWLSVASPAAVSAEINSLPTTILLSSLQITTIPFAAPAPTQFQDRRNSQNDSKCRDDPIWVANFFEYAGTNFNKEYVERGAFIVLGIVMAIIGGIYYAGKGRSE